VRLADRDVHPQVFIGVSPSQYADAAGPPRTLLIEPAPSRLPWSLL